MHNSNVASTSTFNSFLKQELSHTDNNMNASAIWDMLLCCHGNRAAVSRKLINNN